MSTGKTVKSVVMTTRYPINHPGGVESVARALIDCFDDAAVPWDVSHVRAYSNRSGMGRIPLLGDLVASVRLASGLYRNGDVLVVHGAEYAWACLIVAKLRRRPVVVVWHGVRASEAVQPPRLLIERAAVKFFLWSQSLLQGMALRADATVAVSPSVASELNSRYGFSGAVSVIPNGVATRAKDARREDHSPAPPGGAPLRVIWVGTSGYKKGLDLALQACEIARAQGHRVSLTVAGVAADATSLRSAASADWLSWLGPVPPGDMEALYHRHDVMLFPTRYEACPMVVLEALAEGLPVIGSSVVRWLIDGAGAVVSGEDAGAYAEALTALTDPDRRRRLSEAGIERAHEFSWEAAAAGYLKVLDTVTRRHSSSARA